MLSEVHRLLPCEPTDLGWWKRPGAYDQVYGGYRGQSGWTFVPFSSGTVRAISGNI